MLQTILLAALIGLFSVVAYHGSTYGRRGRRWGA